MSTSLSQLLEESDLPFELSADLEPVLTALRSLTPEAAPQPSAQLAALLAHPVAPRSYRPRRAALAAVAAVVGSFTLTGVAAAANQLPESAQQFVSDLSSRYLPFQFPEPPVVMEEAPTEPKPGPEDEAPVVPATTEEPSPESPSEDGSPKAEKPSKKSSAVTTPDDGPSASTSPSAPETSPAAPEPSEAPTPSAPEPSVGAEEPVESPTAGETTSPSPSGDSTEPEHARENETPTVSERPSPTAAPTSGSTSPSAG